nr:hypothetical protein [Tanacetum cinerariifolium]
MGDDAFVRNGFKGWNRSVGFTKHVGKVNNVHNQAREKYESLMKPKTSIQNLFDQLSAKSKRKYLTRLLASLHCIRLLLHQDLSTRGKKEGLISINNGIFLELLAWLAKHNEDINKVVLRRAPKNYKLTFPFIQIDLIKCCTKEISKIIIKEFGEDYFVILAYESFDVSHKEQMSLCLRYVDKKGAIVERFLGILHVKDTNALTLRDEIYSMLAKHSLSPSRIRGQGYDGASNMKGGINGLKTLILKESKSAYYIHCFAHQLQLTLVVVSKKCTDCGWIFEALTNLLNVVGVSFKRVDMLREIQAQ